MSNLEKGLLGLMLIGVINVLIAGIDLALTYKFKEDVTGISIICEHAEEN